MSQERDTASYALRRVEHFRELGGLDYDDLSVLLAADVEDDVDDPYPVVELHARTDAVKGHFDFDARFEFEGMGWKTFRDVEYPTWISRFEDWYSDTEVNLQYWEPDDY